MTGGASSLRELGARIYFVEQRRMLPRKWFTRPRAVHELSVWLAVPRDRMEEHVGRFELERSAVDLQIGGERVPDEWNVALGSDAEKRYPVVRAVVPDLGFEAAHRGLDRDLILYAAKGLPTRAWDGLRDMEIRGAPFRAAFLLDGVCYFETLGVVGEDGAELSRRYPREALWLRRDDPSDLNRLFGSGSPGAGRRASPAPPLPDETESQS